ncbi:MAG: HEPN domain-containing protein [Oscillospiraceae bacterium]|nr:HEPN domain-containing protein [Oscillospiraceae bacterium]MBR7055566.1 HEPN domain-containing protein [Oscillospiraceae bacterium]
MQDSELRALSRVRLDHARECLDAAISNLETGQLKTAANRSYYAAFHAIRAILALDGVDYKRHSGVISEFQRRYIKTAVFPRSVSPILMGLFDIRTRSDYDDFYVIAKADILSQVEGSKRFVDLVGDYLSIRWTEMQEKEMS